MLKIKKLGNMFETIYERDGYYYPTKIKAIFKIKNKEFDKYARHRFEIGESKYFREIGSYILTGLKEGLRDKEEI